MFSSSSHLHMKVSSFSCLNAESPGLNSGIGTSVFSLRSANPSTSPANGAAVALLLRLFSFYCRVAAFFGLVGRNDALHAHMLDLFSVVFEQVTAGFAYWRNPQFTQQTAPRKLKNSSLPADPCCDCKHKMQALALRFRFLFCSNILYF